MDELTPLPPNPPGAVVVAWPDEIDYRNAPVVGDELAGVLIPGAATVVLDLGATTFCTTAGVQLLIRAQRLAAAVGTDLRVVVPGGATLRILRLTGLDQVLASYPSVAAAVGGTSGAE